MHERILSFLLTTEIRALHPCSKKISRTLSQKQGSTFFKQDHSDRDFLIQRKKLQNKKNSHQISTGGTEKKQRITCGLVVFTGHRCSHSFTERITTIFRDEVILFSPKNTWGYLFSGS